MWTAKNFLKGCQALHEAGLLKDFEIGDKVGRGFADMGVEEFLVMSDGRLLSLYTGQISAIGASEQAQLFLVPSVSQLLAVASGTTVEHWQVESVDSRTFRATASLATSAADKIGKAQVVSEGKTLELALLQIVAELKGVNLNQEKARSLRTVTVAEHRLEP